MNHREIISHLVANADIFAKQFQSVADGQACWKPGPDRWSILEVVNHLYDEEREDFRKRLRLVLDDPEQAWPPIDPEGWVIQRGYNERDFRQSVQNFFKERDKSLQWLNRLESPDWQAVHRHPQMGPMSADLLLANWLAHDLFHIRQVNDLQFEYFTEMAKPVSLNYSGWG